MQLEVARANEARAVDELAATRTKLAETRTRVARFAAQIYQDQGMGQLDSGPQRDRPPTTSPTASR